MTQKQLVIFLGGMFGAAILVCVCTVAVAWSIEARRSAEKSREEAEAKKLIDDVNRQWQDRKTKKRSFELRK